MELPDDHPNDPTQAHARRRARHRCLALGATASLGDVRQAGNSPVFVGTFEDHQLISDTVPGDYPCFAGVTGTITGTDDVFGRFNNAPDFFHFTSTETVSYRIVFSDGRYVVGGFVAHFGVEANAESGAVLETTHEPSQERATVYSADGQPIGTVTISTTSHVRFSDLNGNGEMDPGEVTGIVDRIKVTCG
jgi:hypothetical protein